MVNPMQMFSLKKMCLCKSFGFYHLCRKSRQIHCVFFIVVLCLRLVIAYKWCNLSRQIAPFCYNLSRQITPFWYNLSRQIAPFVCNNSYAVTGGKEVGDCRDDVSARGDDSDLELTLTAC